MPTTSRMSDTPAPASREATAPLRRPWTVLLGSPNGAVEARAHITASSAVEVLDYLEDTLNSHTLLGIIDTNPPNLPPYP